MKKFSRLPLISWLLYDWASSPFSVLLNTFIFATYFTEKVAVNKIEGAAQWGYAAALAGLIVALCSPILGAIADYEGRRKPWLFGLTILTVISALALWFVKPQPSDISWALCWIVLGTIGLETSTVFYNSMLNDLAPAGFLGRISGWGWGLGYLGGLCALFLSLKIFITGNGAAWLGLNLDTAEQIRICGPLVAIWLLLFSLPIFLFTTDRPSTGRGFALATQIGLRSLWKTLKTLIISRQHHNILFFLLARMLYIDGLITVFAFGGIYAAGVFNMSTAEIIQFGIAMNLAAGLGAGIFAWLDDARGPKLTILLALSLMILCGIGILIVKSKLWFWTLGMGLSLGVGPVQAASRSLFIRVAPRELITEFFGLYAFSGKATSFLGPWILGITTTVFNSQRIGMSTVFVFMIIGGVLLSYGVRVDR